jgi:SHS2 domain-containing protein
VSAPRFRQLSHTADLRLAVWGNDELELVENAVLGTMRAVLRRDVHATPVDAAVVSPWPAELSRRLVRATNEALFRLYRYRQVSIAVEVGRTRAVLRLAPLPLSWPVEVEIKAVTYHDLRPALAGERWRAILTLDV